MPSTTLNQKIKSSENPSETPETFTSDMSINDLNDLYWSTKSPKPGLENRPEKLAYRKHVCSLFDDMKIKDFKSAHGLKVRHTMQENSFNPTIINNIITTGRQEFNMALEKGVIANNPWKDVAFLPHAVPTRTIMPIAPNDLKILLDQFHFLDLGNYMKLLLSSDTQDISPSTLLSARVSDYNEAESSLILRSVPTGKGSAKKHTSVQIQLSPESATIIQAEIKKRIEKKEKSAPEKWSDSPDYLFCTWSGNPISRAILNSYVHVIQQNTGLSWFSIQRLHNHAKYTGIIETFKLIYDELNFVEN